MSWSPVPPFIASRSMGAPPVGLTIIRRWPAVFASLKLRHVARAALNTTSWPSGEKLGKNRFVYGWLLTVIGDCTSTDGVPNVCWPPVNAYDIRATELLLTSTDWPGSAEANTTLLPSA